MPPLATSNVPVVSDKAIPNVDVAAYDGKPDDNDNCSIDPAVDVASLANEFAALA